MFNSIGNIISELKHENSETWQQTTTKIIEGTLLASVCAYGGTYFFTRYPPRIGASYFGIVVLVSQVVYRALEELKKSINLSCYRNVSLLDNSCKFPSFFIYFMAVRDRCYQRRLRWKLSQQQLISLPFRFLFILELLLGMNLRWNILRQRWVLCFL